MGVVLAARGDTEPGLPEEIDPNVGNKGQRESLNALGRWACVCVCVGGGGDMTQHKVAFNLREDHLS